MSSDTTTPSRKRSALAKTAPAPANDNAMRRRAPRILLWDIESTSLNATFGTILCIGWKWHGQRRVRVPTILDAGTHMLDDRRLVEEFAEAFGECDYHATWYGERFDLPMVKSKLIRYGLPPLPPKPHLDLWKTARKNFKLHSNRLAVWQQFLGLEHEKTPLDFDHWLKAAQGDRKALGYVRDHCAADVRVLEEVFDRLRPWMDNEPARSLITGEPEVCQSCGSADIRRRGFKVAQTRTYVQYRCEDCGHWMRGRRAVDTVEMRNVA